MEVSTTDLSGLTQVLNHAAELPHQENLFIKLFVWNKFYKWQKHHELSVVLYLAQRRQKSTQN